MQEITEYFIEKGWIDGNQQLLSEYVNRDIQNGYQPYGPPFLIYAGDIGSSQTELYFGQAMVKYRKNTKETKHE